MKSKILLGASFLSFLLLSLNAGWGKDTVKMSIQPTILPPGSVSPLHVVLVLNDELTGYKYESRVFGSAVFPLGPSLADCARYVATNSFKQVDVVSSTEMAFTNLSADIVLIPRPVKAGLAIGTKVQNPISFTFVVEWLAKDRASQNTIWLKTMIADVTDQGANALTAAFHVEDRREKLMQKLFDNLSIQTYESIQRAPELGMSQSTADKGMHPPGDPNVFVIMLGLKSANPDEVAHTLKLLRKPECWAAAPDILPLLNDKNPSIIRDACRTLAVLDNKDVIPSIEPLLTNKRAAVRKDAQDAIDKLNAKP